MDHPLDHPHQLRRDALLAVMETTRADAAQYYLLVRGLDQLVRIHGCRGLQETEAARSRWGSSDGLAFVFSDADPDHLAPLNHFGSPPPDLYALPFFRWAIVDVGYNSVLYSNIEPAVKTLACARM